MLWAIRVKNSIPTKAPRFWTIELTPIQNCCRPAISASGTPSLISEALITSPTSSGLKNPIPQRPITPETHSSMPRRAGLRQRGSPRRAV